MTLERNVSEIDPIPILKISRRFLFFNSVGWLKFLPFPRRKSSILPSVSPSPHLSLSWSTRLGVLTNNYLTISIIPTVALYKNVSCIRSFFNTSSWSLTVARSMYLVSTVLYVDKWCEVDFCSVCIKKTDFVVYQRCSSLQCKNSS